MKMNKRITVIVFLIAAALCCRAPSASASPASISYSLTDLGSVQNGLWQADYTVEGYNFHAGEGLTIYFDYGLYADLAIVSAPAGWDALTYDPDMVFGVKDAGALDAMATVDSPSLSGVFSVQFTWLGEEAPGAQNFEIHGSDYCVIESGQSSHVPIPGSLLLLANGLLGILFVRNRR